jgi:hypothetical protein
VFFKITSARARNGAVEGLLKKRFEGTYNQFWRSIFKTTKALDQRRNEIVHWRAVHGVGGDGDQLSHEYSLTPPNIWNLSGSTPSITVSDMLEFEAACDFASRAMNMFHGVILLNHQFDQRQAWARSLPTRASLSAAGTSSAIPEVPDSLRPASPGSTTPHLPRPSRSIFKQQKPSR